MTRLHSEIIPTSTLAATARVVDGFVAAQTATDGQGNTPATHTDLAGRGISSTARRRWGGSESAHSVGSGYNADLILEGGKNSYNRIINPIKGVQAGCVLPVNEAV